MPISSEDVEAGQAVYSRRVLGIYDILVLGLSNRWIWKCPTKHLLEHYNRYLSSNHLDVGVGTGYFLDRCVFPSDSPRLALMDLNENSLEFAARRVRRYSPAVHRQNALESIPAEIGTFDSIAVNYLLHCLPGSLEEKSAVFDNLSRLMTDGGVLFGSTLLHDGVARNAMAKKLMAAYNRKGIFSNEGDSLDGLDRVLEQRFPRYSIDVVGCCAIFVGYRQA